jgi:hypothetical protein
LLVEKLKALAENNERLKPQINALDAAIGQGYDRRIIIFPFCLRESELYQEKTPKYPPRQEEREHLRREHIRMQNAIYDEYDRKKQL